MGTGTVFKSALWRLGDVRGKPRHSEEFPGAECGHYKGQVWPHLRWQFGSVEQRIERFQCLHPQLEEPQLYCESKRLS